MSFAPRLRIKTNALLGGDDKTLSLEKALMLKRGLQTASSSQGSPHQNASALANFSRMSEADLKRLHSTEGEAGLFKAVFLAFSHDEQDFKHFYDPIFLTLSEASAEHFGSVNLQTDNHFLPQGDKLAAFNSHVILPSLSRKFFNPGRHPGYLVYGLSRPRILVSYPFRGVNGELYDVYNNSIDVAINLLARGYHGSFLFLDNMPGMNHEICGVPAWLAWFSLVAVHSDIVVFVKEQEHEIRESQRLEILLTPDRVQKKLVEISSSELTWAEKPEYSSADMYVTENGLSTREDFYAKEREHPGPLLEEFASPGFPKDRLIRIGEDGEIEEFPLDFQIYGLQPA